MPDTMKKIFCLLLFSFTLFLSAQQRGVVSSSPLLDPYFRSNAVIQRNSPVQITGTAEAGSKVTVSLEGEKTQETQADENGRWQVEFPEQEGSHKERKLLVQETRKDKSMYSMDSTVRFGDVWINIGNDFNQTRVVPGPAVIHGGGLRVRDNVVIRLGAGQAAGGSGNTRASTPAAEKKEPVIQEPKEYWAFRNFTQGYASSPQRRPSSLGTWYQVQPTNPLYQFLDRISEKENVPVAVICLGFHSMSLPSLMPPSIMENLDAELCKAILDDYELYRNKDAKELAAIKEEAESGKRLPDKPVNEGEQKGWHKENFKTDDWSNIQLPSFLEHRGGFGQVDGAFWFQRIVEIPKDFLRKIEPEKSEFQIRVIHPADKLYTNEVKLDKDFLKDVKVHNAEVIIHDGKAILVQKQPVFTAADFMFVYSDAEEEKKREQERLAREKKQSEKPQGMVVHQPGIYTPHPFRVNRSTNSNNGTHRFYHYQQQTGSISSTEPDFLIPTPEFRRKQQNSVPLNAIMILNGKVADCTLNPVNEWRNCGVTLQKIKDADRQKLIHKIRTAILYARHKESGIILRLGAADDQDITYINGKKIGSTGATIPEWWDFQRIYPIKTEDLKTGKNTITVRVLDERQAGGLPGPYIFLENAAGEIISLHGRWKVRDEWMVDRAIIHQRLNLADLPTYRWNAVIEPLKHLRFKGIVIPDDEPERRYTETPYGYLFKQLVDGFRTGFDDENLPVIYTLTPGTERYRKIRMFRQGQMVEEIVDIKENPRYQNSNNNTDLLRGQLELLDYSNTYAMPTNGIEATDGMSAPAVRYSRLAALALNEVYEHKDIVSRGPTLTRADFGIGKVTLTFDTGGSDLQMMVKGDELLGFELTESKGKGEYVDAKAKIIGRDTIEVWSETMMRPSGVRYNISWCPNGNLFNTAGFPALPFQYGE